MSYSTIITSLENNILIVTINRPDKLNTLNKDVFTDLNNVADEINNTTEISLSASIHFLFRTVLFILAARKLPSCHQ